MGVFRSSGEVREGLVHEILTKIDGDKIIWEGTAKSTTNVLHQMAGNNVNLGNIATNDVIPLETLRLGLRSDTFPFFLPKTAKYISKKK